MKHVRLVLIAVLALNMLAGCNKKDNTAQIVESDAIPVIFDTDVGNDIDDVIAIQMLYSYINQGKIDLLGIGIGKSYPRVIEYIDAFNRFNGFDSIPMGYAYNGVNPDSGKYVPQTLDTIIDGKKILEPQITIKDNLPEGYKLFRKLLASQKDSSVVFMAVGPVTNLARLLDSKGDEYSDLNGIELVGKKVKFLSIMSGTYNDDTFNNPEWNVLQDLEASKKVYREWPTPLIASGSEVGVRILYPHQSILNDFKNGEKNPMCVSYKLYEKMPYDRPTWDLTSVVYAVEPDDSGLDISPKGTITIEDNGFSRFEASENGKHQYLIIKPENVQKAVQKLVDVAADKRAPIK